MATKTKKKTRKRSARRPRLNVLFTCVGRRVELLQAFRAAAEAHGVDLKVTGADKSRLAPALHLCDRAVVTPEVLDPSYVSQLLDAVRRERVDLLIPLIDHELLVIAGARARFDESGCVALISDERVVETCRDKVKTFESLMRHGIDTPQTWPIANLPPSGSRAYPYFMKPRRGSASFGNHKIHNDAELDTFGRLVKDPIIQEFVEGVEHTLDVYTGLDGKPRCVVPRRRLEVRWGEVSKGQVVKDPKLIETGCRVVEALGGCRGVVTIQCIVTPAGRIRVIEINPRFGGGAPLSMLAGADLAGWIIEERLGRRPRIRMDGYRDGVRMLRYDQSVFLDSRGRVMNGAAHRGRGARRS